MENSLLGLTDKVAIVSGAAVGMGRAIALKLAAAGANLTLVDIDAARLKKTASDIQAMGRRAIDVQADARDKASVQRVFAQTIKEFGRLDVCVNNAGGVGILNISPTPIMEAPDDFWDKVIEQNLRTTFLACREAARTMVEHKTRGGIINIASISGVRASVNLAPYGAAKAAVIHLTQSLALELAPHGIRVNAIAPASIATFQASQMMSEEGKKASAKAIPLGRLGDPDEIGGIVVFLASDLSSFVTGHTVIADGGLSCTMARPAASKRPLGRPK